MDLTASATFEVAGEFDWTWLAQRIALPGQFPLPPPAGRVPLHLAATLATDGTARLDLRIDYVQLAPPTLFGGLLSIGPRVRLELSVQYANEAELTAARQAWDAPTPGTRLTGELRLGVALRFAPLPSVMPVRLRTGDAEGWIAVDLTIAAGSAGDTVALRAASLGEVDLNLPALPLAQAPLRAALDVVAGTLTRDGQGWSGALELEGRCLLAPRIEAGEVALLGVLAPLLEGVSLSGALGGRLELSPTPRLTLWSTFDDTGASVDILGLLAELGRNLTGAAPLPALDADLRAHSTLGFELRGVALRIDAADPAFAIDLAARFGGVELPAHIEISTTVVRAGLGTSSLADAAVPLELPLRVPHVTAADLGYGGGVAAARARTDDPPPDQWIWERVSTSRRADYDAHVQLMVDAVEALTGAASGGTGSVVARRHADHWELLARPGAPQPDPGMPVVLGVAAVQAEHAGAWRATGDLALAARIDGRWQVLIAAPRLRFVDFRIEFDLRNPRRSSIGGTVAFAFTDGAAQEQVIEAEAELSADAIYFSVRQLSAAPMRVGEIELRIARLLFGFGYTKRSLAVAFAGELELPEALVDALDSSDAVGVGVRVPQRTSLDFQFEVMPLYVGKAVVPIPMFQFDWDGRQRQSQALRDTRLCEPYWDGLQLIVDGVARIGLKRLSFSPLLAFFACANSDFDGDLALGNAHTGLTIVADNLFWPYGLDSGAAVTLAPLHVVPYGDNLCISVRAAGFRLNFNVQRPVPTFSPLALFEAIALVTDLEHYQVAARGPLADSVRISLTDAWFVLPGPVRRLFPGVDGVHGKVFEKTINLADYIRLLQGAIAVSRQFVKGALQAGDDAAAVAQRLRQAATALQDGGLTDVLAELLAAVPAELRATRLDASFAGFDGHAVLVLTDTASARAEMAARADPASPFHAPAFDSFTADDFDAVVWPGRSDALRADDLTPALVAAIRAGSGTTGKALRSGLASDLRAQLERWDGELLPSSLRERLARELDDVLAGSGSGKTLGSRTRARQLPLPETAARLAARSTAKSLSGWELKHLNRAVMEATLPAPRTTIVVIAGARLRVAGTAGLGFLGGIAADGRFAFVSAAHLPTLELMVAGIAVPLPLAVAGRLRLEGRAGPLGIDAEVRAEVTAAWEPMPALVRVTLGSAKSPCSLMLGGDGRFRVAGDGALAVRGDLLRVDGRFDVADTHAWLEGRLKHTLGSLASFDVALAGAIGPGERLALQGEGAVKLLGMPLAEVEIALDTRRLAVSGRLTVDQWSPPGIAAAPVAVDARLAGALDLQVSPPDLRLEGSGRVALFGAELARGRVGVERRTTKRPGRPNQPWLATWFEGSLSWHGREWLGARVELDDRTASVRGRSALHFELKPPGSQTALMLTLSFDASLTLGLPAGTLGGLSLRGEWWLGLKRGQGSGALRVPIAVGQVPALSEGDLPRVLLAVPELLLPRLDGFDEWPLPTLKVTETQDFSVPAKVRLPALVSIWESLTAAVGFVLKGTRYKGHDADDEPLIDLTGKTTYELPKKLEIGWPDAELPDLFERFDGFALVLDWDDDSKQLVLRADKMPPAPRIEVEFDPKGIDLGAEFIAFVNDTAEPIRLAGWSVQDAADRARRFVFPDVTLAPGQRLTLWSHAGNDDAANLHWGRQQAVWNNEGDIATLFDERGIARARLAFGPTKASKGAGRRTP